MEPTLVYEESTETIRQMPQNYLIAYRVPESPKACNRWVCEPDLAADKALSKRVFEALFDFKVKYGDGLNLLSKVTPNWKFEPREDMILVHEAINTGWTVKGNKHRGDGYSFEKGNIHVWHVIHKGQPMWASALLDEDKKFKLHTYDPDLKKLLGIV